MEIKNIILGLGIFILSLFVVIYGINTFYATPQYTDFCNETKTMQFVDNASACSALDGRWNPQNIQCIKEPCPQGYCDLTYYCNQAYQNATESHAKVVFFIALPLGIAIIAVGAVFFGLEAVGAGLMLGGVGTLIYGIGGYWRYTDNWLRFLISLIALGILIWFSYWFNARHAKNKKSLRKK